MGYNENTKCYSLFDLEELGKIIRARDVKFFENKFSIDEKQETAYNENTYNPVNLEEDIFDQQSEIAQEEDSQHDDQQSEDTSTESDSINENLRRTSRKPTEKQFPDMLYLTEELNISTSVEDSMRNSAKQEWKKAMEEEYSSLIENQAWCLVEEPKNKKL